MIVCGTVELLGGLRAISLASLDSCLLFGFALGAGFAEVFAFAVAFGEDFVVFLFGFFLVAILSSFLT
jgi:hypothetical protein